MLIVKNLCKTYRSKGGVSVKALDDVSITFPETGMVFLLGKSGSGKSTLLNVCGGLDTPDSGEIIVRGRSSKTFSGSDFDSYRNTFVGFIFQEYNVLNEFTVEENLSLALELQGKGKDKKRVNELLKQVDLEGFACRKPQTLSGGQKQRIAIARALIKDPKIIMADEPTGALDSNTGKQVLDTLKKLSQTRLVIIVSHDREFAEIYGDRIIELKDGKIISDASKEKVAAKEIGGNIAAIGKHTISVKKGSQLTDSELSWIRDFISRTDSDVLITNGTKDIEGFRKSSRIAADNSCERFTDTKTDKIAVRTYSKKEGELVRSHLPMGKAIKMGASSLKVKPFRLFFTILLATAAFVLFGVFSTLMTYNKTDVLINSFMDSGYTSVRLKKQYLVTTIGYEDGKEKYRNDYPRDTGFTAAEITELEKKYGDDVLGAYAFSGGVRNIVANTDTPKALNDSSLNDSTLRFAYAKEGSSYRAMVAGSYPVASDEIAVSEWYATMMAANTVYDVDMQTAVDIGQPSDVVGKYVLMSHYGSGSDQMYKITGVFKSEPIPSIYDGYADKDADIQTNEELLIHYSEFLSDSTARVMLVGETFAREYIARTNWKYQSDYSYIISEKYFFSGMYFNNEQPNGQRSYEENYWQTFDADSEDMFPVHFIDEKERKTLAENEIIVSPEKFVSLYRSGVSEQIYAQKIAEWNNGDTVALYQDKEKQAGESGQTVLANFYGQIAVNTPSVPQWIQGTAFSAEQKKEALDVFFDFIDFLAPDLSFTFRSGDGSIFPATLVGFYDVPSDGEDVRYGTYVSAERESTVFYDDWREVRQTKYVESGDILFQSVFVPFADKTEKDVRAVISATDVVGEDDSFYSLDSWLYTKVDSMDYFLSFLSTIFLYVGIGLGVFAALLLFNFISVSISNKTHEIGVLRAVGARGADVFKIFFAESAIITSICFVLSLAGAIVLVGFLNGVIAKMLGMAYTLLVFGGISFVMMFGVALVVAFLGTFFPVFRISRRKPVDSMRSM